MSKGRQTKLQKTIEKALAGDEDAIAYMDVKDKSDVSPMIKKSIVLTWEKLLDDYHNACLKLVAAENLQLQSLRKTSIPYLKYLLWIAKNHFKKDIPEQASTCSREDVLTAMHEMTFDVPPEKLRNKSFQVSNDDGLKAPTPGTSATRKRKRSESKEEETEYSPAGKTGKRSHHSRFQCKMPECNAVVSDIGRHLKIHVRKRELLQENVNAMIEIIRHGKQQFGPIKPRDSKGPKRRRKWCPIEGCDAVVTYVGNHLKNVHQVKHNTVEYKMHLEAARPYLGLDAEMNVLLEGQSEMNEEVDEIIEDVAKEDGGTIGVENEDGNSVEFKKKAAKDTDEGEDMPVKRVKMDTARNEELDSHSEEDKKKPSPEETPSPEISKKKSHHKKTKCRITGCTFYSWDLNRHMKTHVRKGHLDEENLSRVISLSSASTEKPDGRRKRWCPIDGCDAIIKYVSKHLRNVHNMEPNSNELKELSKSAREYAGLKAEIDLFVNEINEERPSDSKESPEEEEEEEEEEELDEKRPLSPNGSRKAKGKSPVKPVSPITSHTVSEQSADDTGSEYEPSTDEDTESSPSEEKDHPSRKSASPKTREDYYRASKFDNEEEEEELDEKRPMSPNGSRKAKGKSPVKPVSPITSHTVSEQSADDTGSEYEPSTDEDTESSPSEEKDHPSRKSASPKTREDYYRASKFDNGRHQWLCGFFNYLSLPSSGYKKIHIRLQHVTQVKILLEALDPKGTDIKCLAEDHGNAIWTKYIDPEVQAGNKAPGTLISYLTSVEKFLQYVTSQKYDPKQMPHLLPSCKKEFKRVIPNFKGWRACIDSFTQDRQLRRYIQECDDLITPEQLEEVKSSIPYTEGENVILKASLGKPLNMYEFTLARDLIIFKFSIATGARPSALNNALLEDFKTATSNDGKRVILVPKHKRSKDGPAMLGMNEELQLMMSVYVEFIRPQFAMPSETKLFIKNDGFAFNEGTIGKVLSRFLEKTKVFKKRVSHTHIRKFIATQTYQHASPQEVEHVEKAMCHGKDTRKKCYIRQDCTRTTAAAMDIIERVLRPSKKK